jgi:hypothetical protein
VRGNSTGFRNPFPRDEYVGKQFTSPKREQGMAEESTIATEQASLRWDWKWVRIWTCVFVVNVIVPLYFILQTPPFRFIGIAIGIVSCWFFGLVFQYFPEWFRKNLTTGCIFLACLQFFPVLHFLAVVAADASMDAMIGDVPIPDDFIGTLDGLIRTIVTGQILLAFAVLIPLPFTYDDFCMKRIAEKRTRLSQMNQSASHEITTLESN